MNNVMKFQSKLKNQEYISNFLYLFIKQNYNEYIPYNFDIDKYNDKVLEIEYEKYKIYFEDMYKRIDNNIHLDKEQIKAILADEDYSLILAGAGTGKTTTMASKVKYLVDIKKVDPNKIIVLSYTKKATEELKKRIVLDFNLDVNVTTFHALGFEHIRQIFNNRKCYVVDDNFKKIIFEDYFKNYIFPNKKKLKEIITVFNESKITSYNWVFGNYFLSNYDKYDNFDSYFEAYKKYKLNSINNLSTWLDQKIDSFLNGEYIITIKGEFVKSKGEALIANFLFKMGIEYKYEKIYKDFVDNNKSYRPDFTLLLNDEEIYLEYFGLSNYKGDELNRYYKIAKIKENYHKKHNNKFIKIDYMKNEDILNNLKNELIKYGFIFKPKSDIEIFNEILNHNKLSQLYNFMNFMIKNIETIKSSSHRNNYLEISKNYIKTLDYKEREEATIQLNYINQFYQFYQKKLYGSEEYGFDFSDMIYYANQYINKLSKDKLNYEYLIIDEYQDISEDRYLLTKNISNRNNAKVIAVGDDWQSIFSFAGSKVKYTYNFLNYFKGSKLLKITKTYRNSKELINYTGNFIMKNPNQIKKDLVSDKSIKNPIKFILYEDNEEYDKLKQLILYINKFNKNHNILILSRKNKTIDNIYEDKIFKDDIGTKITILGHENISIDGMTIHKSKGLTSDEVIVIGLDKSFPSYKSGLFWLENLFKNELEYERIPYAEERRLFYVALTRTKNYVYLLVNKNSLKRSAFINELYNIIKEV